MSRKSWTITQEHHERSMAYVRHLRADRDKWKAECRKERAAHRKTVAGLKLTLASGIEEQDIAETIQWVREEYDDFRMEDPFCDGDSMLDALIEKAADDLMYDAQAELWPSLVSRLRNAMRNLRSDKTPKQGTAVSK